MEHWTTPHQSTAASGIRVYALLARMRREGIEFVPLAAAIADPAYSRVATIVTDSFHVYQQKM